MPLSKKDRKYILSKQGQVSAKDLASELGVKPKEVQEVIDESGSRARAQVMPDPGSGLLGFTPVHPLAILFLVAVIAVVYLNSVRNGFHYDDIHSLIQNLGVQVEWTRNPESRNLFYRYFLEPELFSSRPQVGMPRPILMVTFALNYMWTRYEPWSWVLVNIGLHAINTIIIYVGLCHLTGRRRLALLTALLFAVHPINTETVNYINCRSESMGVMFMLGMIYFYVRSLHLDRLDLRIAGLVCFVLGLLTKEMVFVTPAIVAAIDILFVHPANPNKISLQRRLLFWYLPLVIVWGAYFAYRNEVMPALIVERTVRPISDNLVTQSRALLSYVRLLFLPFHQNISYENQVYTTGDMASWFTMFYVKIGSLFKSPEESAALWQQLVKSDKTFGGVTMVYFSMAFLASMAGLALVWVRKRPVITFCISLFFITLSITSLVPLNAIMNEHRLYLPSLGACLLIAGALDRLAYHLGGKPDGPRQSWPALVQVLSVSVVLLFGSLTIARNFTWHTDLTVWTNSIRNSPEKAQVVSDLGNVYYRTGRDVAAGGGHTRDNRIDRSERIIINQTFRQDVPEGEIDAETRRLLEGLFMKGLNRGELLYRWGVRVELNYFKAWHNLGTIYYTYASVEKQKGNWPKARENYLEAFKFFQRAWSIAPSGESYNDGASTLLQVAEREDNPERKRKYYETCEELYKKAVLYNPELYKAYTNLARVQQILRKPEEAIQNYRKAIQIYPLDTGPYGMMAELLLRLERFEEAQSITESCLKVNPSDRNCQMLNKKAQEQIRLRGR